MTDEQRAKLMGDIKTIIGAIPDPELAADILIIHVGNCLKVYEGLRSYPPARNDDAPLDDPRAKDRERKRRQRENAPDVSPGLRYRILARDGYRCTYCGAGTEDVELQVDHIIPRARGGDTEPGNLTTACGPCNRGKGDRL